MFCNFTGGSAVMNMIKKILLIIVIFYFFSLSPSISNASEQPSQTYEIVRNIGKGDFERGLEHIFDLSKKGNGAATFLFANLFLEFDDLDNARKYLTIAAKQKDPNAIKFLGTGYFNGVFGDKDYENARMWFNRGAALRNINSMVYLGIIYRDGLGTPMNNERAYFWFSLAEVLKKDGAGHKEPGDFAEEIKSKIAPDKIVKIKTEIETWLEDHPAVPATPIPPID